jgi:acyl carrier protein
MFMAKPSSQKAPRSAKPAKTAKTPAAKPKNGKNGNSKPAAPPKNGKNGKNGSGKPAKPQAPPKAAKAKALPAPPPKPAPVDKKTKQQQEFEAKMLHMVAEEMAIEEAELTLNANFREDLKLDEIDIAELLMQAETTHNIAPFSEADWEACVTVADFLRMVGKRVEAKRARKGK